MHIRHKGRMNPVKAANSSVVQPRKTLADAGHK